MPGACARDDLCQPAQQYHTACCRLSDMPPGIWIMMPSCWHAATSCRAHSRACRLCAWLFATHARHGVLCAGRSGFMSDARAPRCVHAHSRLRRRHHANHHASCAPCLHAGAETDAFMLLDYCPTTLLDMMQRSHFNLDEFFVYEVFSEVWRTSHKFVELV